MGQALLLPAAVVCASLFTASAASAEPPPAPPVGAPVAPPPIMERRSTVAMSGGIAGVAIGSILLVSSAFSGGVQASCNTGCNHTSLIVGLVAAGTTLIAAGIPLIIWGARMVPVAGPTPTMALVPRRPPPSWARAIGSGGWALQL